MAGQQDPGKDTGEYTLLWIILSIAVIGIIIWHFWSAYLQIAFIFVKKYEALALSFFFDNENMHRALVGLNMATPDNLTYEYSQVISTFLGQYLMYPICFVLAVMAIILLKGHASMRFNKIFNMDSLVQQEKSNYPQIAPVADIDLIAEDVNKGPWAMSMNPMQFSRHFKLLKVELVADHKAAWRSAGIPKATVIKEQAAKVFASQLGPLWTGPETLPPHTKALYAAFLARTEHDTDACRGYLKKLSQSAAKGTINYDDTDMLLKKYADSKPVKVIHQRHAYVLTVMASMLVLARVDGVLAAADFLWVKPLDRRLWYTLNCVGRQVAVPEVAGVFAHWLAEREMERALSVPMVDEATKALEIAIANMIYIPEEDEKITQEGTG